MDPWPKLHVDVLSILFLEIPSTPIDGLQKLMLSTPYIAIIVIPQKSVLLQHLSSWQPHHDI